MNTRKLFTATFLAIFVAAPLCAQTSWVDDFLKRNPPLKPVQTAALGAQTTSTSPSALIAEVLQTGAVPLMMQDVVNMMLDHNLDIQSNRFSPRSSYFSSQVFYRALQPSIRFSGTLARNTTASTTLLNGATVLSQLTDNFAVNFSQALPWGTSLAVDTTMNRLSSNSTQSTYNPSFTGKIVYTVGQHLLRDRGKSISLRQIRTGENTEKISETTFEIQITNLIATAQKAYWDLVFAGEDLKVKQRSVDVAQRTLNENQTKVEIGTLARIDVVQTQSDLATRKGDLVTSTGSLTTTEDQIKKLISDDKNPSMFLMRLAAMESPKRPGAVTIPTLEDAVKIALENRPEMRQAMLDLDNKEIDLTYTANQKLPILDVTGTYTQNGTGGTQTKRATVAGVSTVTEVIPGGLSNAFGQLFGNNYNGYSLGFSFTYPLSNRAATADHDRADNERRLSQSKLVATAQQIMLDVRNAITALETNRARIETSGTALDYARQRLEAEQTKFDLGTSTLRFVLEEQRNVAQAETTEVQSLVNFNKGLVDLDKAMGMTLKRNNIEVEKALKPPSIASQSSPAVGAN